MTFLIKIPQTDLNTKSCIVLNRKISRSGKQSLSHSFVKLVVTAGHPTLKTDTPILTSV